MIHYAVEKRGQEIWLAERGYEPRFALKTESVFAQCNGYMGVRASHGLSVLDGRRGMFIAGFFNRAYEEESTELVNCPDVTEYLLKLDGEDVYPDRASILGYERRLNIQTGELFNKIRLRLDSGLELEVTDRRFASMEDQHLFVQKIIITPLNGTIQKGELVTGINGQQTNSGVSHFHKIDCRVYEKQFLHVTGYLPEDTLSVLMDCSCSNSGEDTKEFLLKRRGVFGRYTFHTTEGESWSYEKYVYIQKEEDRTELELQKEKLEEYRRSGYESAFGKHHEKMRSIWKRAGIQIQGATLEEDAAIKFAQYHLIVMMPWHRSDCSIAAKGLTGEGYKGHVFWDTEIFINPFFLYTFPEEARNLLEFRYRGLDAAREKAEAYGYQGAMFPWEAAKTGKEETPLYAALNIHTGKANKVWSGIKEHHVTADIIYAIWQYYTMTGDENFMQNCGYEMIFEAAAFWTSRARWDEARGCYVIEDTIGPDEYTEHIDNNAYTNYMARYCTNLAVTLAKKLERNQPRLYQELSQKLNLQQHIKGWVDVTDKIYLPVPDTNLIIPQDDTFLTKKRLTDIEKYKKSQIKQAVLLDYSRDEIVNMQVLKQADVVMLLNLFPHMFPEEVVKKNVLFYEERTIHDSSLSYCAHAQACAAIGQIELAWEFFKRCLVIDLDENPNDSTDGIHAASLGGIWNCVIFGFAGINYEDGQLNISPKIPEHWKEMQFYIQVHGYEIQVRVSNQEVVLKRGAGWEQPLPVRVNGRDFLLEDSLKVMI